MSEPDKDMVCQLKNAYCEGQIEERNAIFRMLDK